MNDAERTMADRQLELHRAFLADATVDTTLFDLIPTGALVVFGDESDPDFTAASADLLRHTQADTPDQPRVLLVRQRVPMAQAAPVAPYRVVAVAS